LDSLSALVNPVQTSQIHPSNYHLVKTDSV
jgi:hypothetical protein